MKKNNISSVVAFFVVVGIFWCIILGVTESGSDSYDDYTTKVDYSSKVSVTIRDYHTKESTYGKDYYTTDRYITTTSLYEHTEKEHVFLVARNKGDCKTFTGDVVLTVVLVDDSDSTWTQQAISDFKEGEKKCTEKIMREAARNGVYLDISVEYITGTAVSHLSMDNYGVWVSEVVNDLGFNDESEVIPELKERYSSKEAPVLFVVNRSGRAFSNTVSTTDSGFEYTVLYNSDIGNYRHELYHLFGAQDFYYPAEVKTVAEKHFPYSSMLIGEDDSVDSFSAYLIGWHNEMDSAAQAFFDEVSWVAEDVIIDGRAESIRTGWYTVRMEDGTYTGNLVEGVIHGKGTFVWDDGYVYEGEWAFGRFNGHGVYKFPDGASIEGEWENSVVNGYAVAKYSNGDVYEGYWSGGRSDGYGTYTFADGTQWQGYWENGEFSG